MKQLHVRLRELRTEYSFRLWDIADRTGYAISTLSDFERGVSLPHLEGLELIAQVYGMTLSQLLEGVSITGQYIPDYQI